MNDIDSQTNRAPSDIYGGKVNDGLQNVISGFGTAKSRDASSILGADRVLDRVALEDIYRLYWISKALDIKARDMTREWRTFECSDIEQDNIEAIEEVERDVDALTKVREALTWKAVYGGGAIVMHVTGQGDMDMPLNPERVKKGQLERLSSVDRWNLIEFSPIDYNPISPTYGTAEWYVVANDVNNTKIHRSRIIFFRGRKMPIRIERQSKCWGDSDIQRWYKSITGCETVEAGIIEGIHQANIDVVAVDGLGELLAMQGGDDKAIKRFMLMDQCKSMLNMAVIDGDDTFTRNAFPFGGLEGIHRVFLDKLAAATDIPVTRLLGSSPGGLTTTGEGDTRNHYDAVSSEQRNDLSPKMYLLDQVLVRSALGSYPVGLKFEWNSLWQMTEEEQATLRAANAQTLATLQSLGIPELVLHKDAIEMGLIKNYTIEDVEKAERDDDFDVDPDNDDFLPPKELEE